MANKTSSGAYKSYTVKNGDKLESIAVKFGTTTDMLIFVNNLKSTKLKAGQVIQVPTNTKGDWSYTSNATVKPEHKIEVTVSKPVIEVRFYTEIGELAAVANDEGIKQNSDVANDIISVNTVRNMSNDCPTFTINLVWRNKWYYNLASNDLLIIYMRRPPETRTAVMFGLIDDIRRTYDFSSGQPQRVCQVTGRGFNKALVNFDIGMITNMGMSGGQMGFNSQLLSLQNHSSAEAIQIMLDSYVGNAIDYQFSNGKTLSEYMKRSLSCHDGELYQDIQNVLEYFGSLWNFIKELSNTPFNETFWEIKNGSPTIIHRETPFNKDTWNSLGLTKISDTDIVNDGLGRSDLETYTLFRVIDSFDEYLSAGMNPLWYKPFYAKYGLSMLEVTTPYMADGSYKSWMVDLYNWNINNNKFTNGNLTVKGKAAYKVGERVILEGENLELYVEGVTHSFNIYQSWTTTLALTRGIEPDQRFRPPWGLYEEFTDATMAAIINSTGGTVIDWTSIPSLNYGETYGQSVGDMYGMYANNGTSCVDINQKKGNINAIADILQGAGLNLAAICGVLANMDNESGFDPTAVGDSGTSYGLCQWHNERKTNVQNYCRQKYGDIASLQGQVEFFIQEAQGSIWGTLSSVSNDTQGAYKAGYTMCYEFERPSDKANKSISRGNLAVSVYCPLFGVAGSGSSGTNGGGSTSGGAGYIASTSGIVQEAMKYLGNPYVWGGSSLTNGCDCSHFVWLVLKNCGSDYGYATSGGWRTRGSAVSPQDVQAGDVLCYNGHVAFYVDETHIVHARGAKYGIECTETKPLTYHNGVVAIRRC